MGKMILVVNSNVYETSQKIVDNTLKTVLDACKEKKLNMIYALKKKNKIEMTRLKYKSAKEMETDVKKFTKQGLKVYRAKFGVDVVE